MNKPNPRPWLSMYKTSEWFRLRHRQLRKNPLCKFCSILGLITPAAVVDHIQAHKGDHALFYSADNVQSLCKACHDSAKQRQESRGVEIGCDESGIVKGWQ